MAGLSTSIYHRCRNVLLRCEELNSHTSLRALFVMQELQPFQNGLPEATSKEERVGQVIDYLHLKFSSDNQSVLAIFLEVLHVRRAEIDSLAHDLGEVRDEVRRILEGVALIDIPYVVVAITRDQAQSMLDVAIKAREAEDNEGIEVLLSELGRHGVSPEDFLDRYGVEPEDWKPFPDDLLDIRSILTEVIDSVNYSRVKHQERALYRLTSFSRDFFSSDGDVRLSTFDQLSQRGCVLIVDPVSLYHPDVMRILAQSELVSNEQRSAILLLSPVSLTKLDINRLIESEINSRIPRSRVRFRKVTDALCEYGVSDPWSLRRRLFRILPETATIVEGLFPNPGNRDIFVGYGEPRGIHRAFSGMRGR